MTNPTHRPYPARSNDTSVMFARRMVEIIDKPCACSRGTATPADCAGRSMDAYRWRPDLAEAPARRVPA